VFGIAVFSSRAGFTVSELNVSFLIQISAARARGDLKTGALGTVIAL